MIQESSQIAKITYYWNWNGWFVFIFLYKPCWKEFCLLKLNKDETQQLHVSVAMTTVTPACRSSVNRIGVTLAH